MAGFFTNLTSGLKRTRESLLGGITNLFAGQKTLDANFLEELEIQLLIADVGVDVTEKIINELKIKLAKTKELDKETVLNTLKSQLATLLEPCSSALEIPNSIRPYVILFVGINGAGKTTTIGKLAKQLQNDGKKIMLAAGDTFRAAAIDQLKVWGERNNVPVIAQQHGADSAAVIYDAFQSAKAKNIDVLIVDTAGRLHTQNNLMEELKKIKRILQKIDSSAPHEVLLVLDATTGQNALNQAKQFHAAVNVTGICLTKLDGTAKGGIIFAIALALKIPIRFVGVGEKIEDLKTFNAKEFIDALFN
ncbi:MAG: signal recognition particle-docking protein FtsY [Gammaproteobacteria bacterium]|nr:signal recognition particle-docking protein FtsY [Gammaproteobacteria bacterium]